MSGYLCSFPGVHTAHTSERKNHTSLGHALPERSLHNTCTVAWSLLRALTPPRPRSRNMRSRYYGTPGKAQRAPCASSGCAAYTRRIRQANTADTGSCIALVLSGDSAAVISCIVLVALCTLPGDRTMFLLVPFLPQHIGNRSSSKVCDRRKALKKRARL